MGSDKRLSYRAWFIVGEEQDDIKELWGVLSEVRASNFCLIKQRSQKLRLNCWFKVNRIMSSSRVINTMIR